MREPMKQKTSHCQGEQTFCCQGDLRWGRMEWSGKTGVSRCKLLYTEWIHNKVLLCSTEKYIQYPVMINTKEYKKDNTHTRN